MKYYLEKKNSFRYGIVSGIKNEKESLLKLYNYGIKELDEMFLKDSKVRFALNNLWMFPIEINNCSWQQLLMVPGIGKKSAKVIFMKKDINSLSDLEGIGVNIKKAKYFISINGKLLVDDDFYKIKLKKEPSLNDGQLSLF